MSTVICPRCSRNSEGKAYRYQRSGYARCLHCNAGIKYSSSLFRENIEPTSWYVPDGCSVSPKSGRILCSHRVHKCGRFISYFVRKMGGSPNPLIQSKRKGTLKKDLH